MGVFPLSFVITLGNKLVAPAPAGITFSSVDDRQCLRMDKVK